MAIERYVKEHPEVLSEGNISSVAQWTGGDATAFLQDGTSFSRAVDITSPGVGTTDTGDVDPTRAFFRVRVREATSLINLVVRVVRDVNGNFEKARKWKNVAAEGGKLALVRIRFPVSAKS